MKASSESQALWSFMTMVTTGMAFQMAPEICLLPYRNSTCCLHRAGFTPLSPEWKPNLLFKNLSKNLSKHKNKSCPCRCVVLQFLLSIFLSSRLVPHDVLFLLFPYPHFGHHQAAPAVTPTSSVLFLSILSAFSAFSCLFFMPPESLTVINFLFFKARRDEMS